MTEIALCGCGTNHQAAEQALRIARQIIKFKYADTDSCPIYIHGIAMGLAQIAQQLFIEWGRARDAEIGMLGDDTAEHTASLYGSVQRRHQVMHAALYENVPYTTDVMKFICDEVGVPMNPADRQSAEAGLTPEAAEQLDLVFERSERGSIADLLKALGINGSSKPN